MTEAALLPAAIAGRYRVERELGRGTLGAVYEVLDEATSARRALKLLARHDPAFLAYLKEEFAILSRLRHDGIVAVHDLGSCPEHGPYFTMDLAGGPSLEAAPPIGSAADGIAPIARQVLEALQHAHAFGVVHADVKPSNLLWDEGRVKLVDFGLSGGSLVGARGTIVYMAPEVLRGEAPSPRADLYSLGMTLVTLVRGGPLFARPADRWNALEAGVLPLLGDLLAGAPPQLRRVLRSLLAERPQDRYRSPSEAIADLESDAGSRRSPEPHTWRLPFGGREREIERLVELAVEGTRGEGRRIVALTGPDGVGKSRLAQELAWRLQGRGTPVAIATTSAGSPMEQWRRLLGSKPGAPLGEGAVLVIDDAHAATAGIRNELLLLLSRAPFIETFVLLSGRREGLVEELLDGWAGEAPPEEMRLEGLSPADVGAILQRELSSADGAGELAELLAASTGGFPRQLERGLEALEAEGLLIRQAGHWLVSPLQVNAGAFREVLERALAAHPESLPADLSPSERAVLDVLAAWGDAPAALATLEAALEGAARAELVPALRRLQDRDLVVRVRDGADAAYRLRSADLVARLFRALRPGAARALASRLAALVQPERDVVRALELRERAGDRAGVLALAPRAVEHLIARGEMATAARILRRLGTGRGPESIALRREAARLSRLAGRSAEALRLLERLAIEEGQASAATCIELAEALEAQGRYDDAVRTLEALPADATGYERGRAQEALLWIRAMQGRHELAEAHGRDALILAREVGSAELEAAATAKLGTLAQIRGDLTQALALFEDSLLRHDALGNRKGMAIDHNGMAACHRMLGAPARARGHLEQAVGILEDLGELSSFARAEANVGNVCYELGDWKAAEAHWRRSLLVALQTRDRLLVASNLSNLADMLKDQGRLEAADRAVARARRASRGLPHLEILTLVNEGEIRLRQGKPRVARRHYARAHEACRKHPEHVPLLALKMGELALSMGRTARARRLVALSLRLQRRQGRAGDAAMAIRLLAALHRIEGRPEAALELLRATVGEHEGSGGLAEARLRAEIALCLRDLGHTSEAVEQAERAREVFRVLGAEPDIEKLASAMENAGAAATERIADLEVLLDVTRAVSSELSLDRLLATIVDKAIEISGAERGFLVLESSGEHPFRSRVGRDARGTTLPERELDVSISIIRDVVSSGQAVAMADLGEGGELGTESMHRLGLRTVVCAPIRTRGAIVGAVYVDSIREHRPFSSRVVALMEALAGQAGIAIANSELYEDQRRKNELISIVSHELRGPLTSLRCYVELLRMNSAQIDPQKKERFLALMDAECTRLSRLVESILDMARLESGKASWSVSLVDVADLLRHALESVRARAEGKGITLELSLAEVMPNVLGNSDRIMQVVINLLDNAIKFTEAGGGVRVEARPRNVTGTRLDFLEVRVRDTGRGIDPKVLDRIFEKFGALGHGDRPGTGLGLAIAKQIVESHGGRIWVESQSGRGTTFAFHLPLPAGIKSSEVRS